MDSLAKVDAGSRLEPEHHAVLTQCGTILLQRQSAASGNNKASGLTAFGHSGLQITK